MVVKAGAVYLNEGWECEGEKQGGEGRVENQWPWGLRLGLSFGW